MQSLLSPGAFGWRGQRVSTKALVLNSSTWFGFRSPPLLQLIRPSPESVPADPQHMCDTGGPCEPCPQAGGGCQVALGRVCAHTCVRVHGKGAGGGGAGKRLCFNEVLNSLSGPHSKNARTLIMHMNACGGKRLEGGQEYRGYCNTRPVLLHPECRSARPGTTEPLCCHGAMGHPVTVGWTSIGGWWPLGGLKDGSEQKEMAHGGVWWTHSALRMGTWLCPTPSRK